MSDAEWWEEGDDHWLAGDEGPFVVSRWSTGYVVRTIGDCGTEHIAGPFKTHDAARAAYLLIIGAGI